MHEHGYLENIIATLVNPGPDIVADSAGEELPNMANLEAMNELVERVKRCGIESLLADNDTGWKCFKHVARQTTRQILDELLIPEPPAEFAAASTVAVVDVEQWLARTDRQSPPRVEEFAWAAQRLWQGDQNQKLSPGTTPSGQGDIL